jgi:hypothetical protein
MIAGFDDISEEYSYKFDNMKATRSSLLDVSQLRCPDLLQPLAHA